MTHSHLYQSPMHVDTSTGRRQWTAAPLQVVRCTSVACFLMLDGFQVGEPSWSDTAPTSSRLTSVCSPRARRLREQLADLYQAIHSSANRPLLRQYEEVVRSLCSHVGENRQQCERLETSLMRWGRSSSASAWKLAWTLAKVSLLAKVIDFILRRNGTLLPSCGSRHVLSATGLDKGWN